MNIHHLKYFIDAAQAGGISQSARANYLTQSAISRAIANLETDLGVDLVVHKQNHFQLTEAGEAVLSRGLEILASLTQLKDIATGHTKTLRGPLRIGCNQAVASRLIGPMLVKIQSKYPEIEPTIKLGNTDQVQHMLERFEIDFGIVVNDGEVSKLYETSVVYRDEFVVVESPRFKEDQPFNHLIVSRTQKGGVSQKYFTEYKKAYGKPLTPKLVVSSWQVIMDLAIVGLGCALVPRFLCEEALKTGQLRAVKHKVKAVPFELCTIVLRSRALPKNAQAILECFPK